MTTQTATRTSTPISDSDVTGVSGPGRGRPRLGFPDGTTVIRWRELPTDHPNYVRGVRATTVVFPNIEDIEALHGHDGSTRIAYDQ